MALDTTPGGASADSYASLAEADAYCLTGRTAGTTWDDADTEVKEAALREAARYLDAAFVWTGSAVSSTQALTWPRRGMLNRNGFAIAEDEIPVALKNAQAEFARQLVASDRAADNDAEMQGIASLSAGPVSLSFRDPKTGLSPDQAILAKDPALHYLSRVVPDAVRLLLVPSWYERSTLSDINTGFVFDPL